MKKGLTLNILRIPVNTGVITAYIEGFNENHTKGTVYAELNGEHVAATGFNKKKTIVRAIAKLHQKSSIHQDNHQ
ncbi:hypothetical protein [Jeotgalibacillus salarius]|uniref:Uncharacterized protein n=1 Tax=Jeotgalibacillus salarius TaxID=546023 RepID=A0A4Y8LE59_9BACL|nr:hypothetical protein [Jeotgalibacillus salarius]TFE00319.1 hypothetical protein E2626_12630 [Jeotgalibacillus salarius]